METESLVDAEVLAKRLGQATSSIYRLAKAGAIPSFKAGPRGRGVRFSVAEVLEALRRPASTARAEKDNGTAHAR